MRARKTVWDAMLDAYHAHRGPLPRRLMAALEAAEAEGGDLRGRQSAAILVVPAAGEAWETRVSLRVEDHPRPLDELARLLTLHDAYTLAGEADGHVAAGRHDVAAALCIRAAELAPGSDELAFWAALGAAQAGDMEQALARMRSAIAIHPGWRELLARLPADAAPGAAAVLARL